MKYGETVTGTFLARNNRFTAQVEINGAAETVHVKNTGRLKELLTKGAKVILAETGNPNRKTRFDLIGAYREGTLFNIDSLAPNKVAAEYLPKLFNGIKKIKPEAARGESRLDFYIEAEGLAQEGEDSRREKDGEKGIRGYIEVKGVTLLRDGGAYFPDAPTSRGIKHLDELAACAKEGYFAAVLFVVQFRGARFVAPNDETGRAFGEALRRAKQAGVRLFAVECEVTKDGMSAINALPVLTGGA